MTGVDVECTGLAACSRRRGCTRFFSRAMAASVEYDLLQRAHWNLVEFAFVRPCTHSDGVSQQLNDQFRVKYERFMLLMTFRSNSAANMRAADKLVMAQLLMCQRHEQEALRAFAGADKNECKAVSPLLFMMVSASPKG